MSAQACLDLPGLAPVYVPEPQAGEFGRKLRPYQQEAREGVHAVHARSRGALVVLATGLGKTTVLGAVAWDRMQLGERTLVLCPTIVLCQQLYRELRGMGLRVALEQASNYSDRPLPDVVVASVATMRGPRLKGFKPMDFQLVVADECHLSVSDSYTDIFEHFGTAKLLGLTATPDRADGIALANVFDEVAYDMPVLKGIEGGWLAPLRFKTAHTDFDASRIKQIAGEVDPGSVAQELVRSGALHQAANTLAELGGEERMVAFLPTVAASQAFVAELAARGVSAAHIDGTTPDVTRKDAFAKLAAGEIRVLSNVGVLVLGFDLPSISVIALLNPTKSRGRLMQMIGRGTRLSEGKTHCLVVDFCHGRLRKGRLASPADALAGKMLRDEVYDQLASEGDLAQAITDAENTAEKLEQKRLAAERRAAIKKANIERMRAFAKKQKFKYETQQHDAAAVLGGWGGADAPATSGELTTAPRTALADRDRLALGIWSEKQENLLRKYGIVGPISRSQASWVIGLLSQNKWRVTTPLREMVRRKLGAAVDGVGA